MKTVAAVVALVLVVSDGTLSREQRLGAAVSTSTEILQACREQRLDGALPNFSASVACSNPGIRATIAATEYPHMDVIDRWLSYRVAVAGRADAGELSEVEATSLLSELTYRITTDSMHIVHPQCHFDNHMSPVSVALRARLVDAVPNLPLSLG